MPLLMQVHAANKVLAVQFSEGKISQSEYEAGLQKNEADFALVESEYIPRNQQAQADAWHRAGMAMQQSMALQNQQNFQQQMLIQQNRPIQTNCNRFGSSINCTTW